MMKTNTITKVLTGIAAVLTVVAFSAVSAHAGSARRHTVEGIVLGTSLAILGATLINELDNDRTVHVNHYYHDKRRRPGKGGHDRWDSGVRNQYPRNYYNTNRNPDRYDNNWHWKDHKKKHRRKGHWEIRKTWVAPVYEKVWVEGHYNRRKRCWVSGHWRKYLVRDGYYRKERIRVSHWN